MSLRPDAQYVLYVGSSSVASSIQHWCAFQRKKQKQGLPKHKQDAVYSGMCLYSTKTNVWFLRKLFFENASLKFKLTILGNIASVLCLPRMLSCVSLRSAT